jgi:RNA polymerase sigma-70 factor, ECF subfamily
MTYTDADFKQIHKIFQPKILRYLSRLVGGHEAEDLTQEVFIKVSQALNNFRGESKLSTWIYKIATNAALDQQRNPAVARKNQINLLNIPAQEIEIDIEDKKPSVEKLMIRKEMNQCIRYFIENLPSDYRTVIVLSELEMLKNREIAEILGITPATVKIRLHRAKAKLKNEFETHCNFYRDERNVFSCDLKSALKEFRGKH